MKTEDGYIVHECINGDKSAFAILIDKYKAAVFAIAYDKLRNFHDAQDVAQEVFIKAFQKLGTLKNYDKFAVWIHSITNNLCKNYIRFQSRRPDSEFLEDQKESAIDSNSMRSFKDDIENEMINDALNSLPEIYRQVITLHYLGGMKDSEIAEFLGMSHTNVRQRLMKARTQLKEELLSMMDRTFEEQKLQAGFTFRVVEMIKRIKIHPITQAKNLPWGISLVTGFLIAILSINPAFVSFNNVSGTFIFPPPILAESKVLEVGEMPVDVVKTSNITVISNFFGNGKGIKSNNNNDNNNNSNASLMAPKVEGEWTKKADMPTSRCGAASCELNGKIYVFGGTHTFAFAYAAVEEYNTKTDTWTKKNDAPTKRGFASASAVNGKIYVIGGGESGQKILSAVEEYDPLTDTWIKKTDILTARAGLTTCMLNDKIYAIGGLNGFMADLNIVEEYDPKTDTWKKKSDMAIARENPVSCAVNGKIYVIGGWNGNSGALSSIEEYDPINDIWTKKSDMPTARAGHSACVVNNMIYVIGGNTNFGPGLPAVSTVEVYDPSTDTWTKKADITTPRQQFCANAVNGYIYAIGGAELFLGWAFPSTNVLPIVEAYDTGFRTDKQFSVGSDGKLPNTWGKIKAK
jgi:RNA polymerase sigma factor (sigma-70 family)